MDLDISFSQETRDGTALSASYRILGSNSVVGPIMDIEMNIDLRTKLWTSTTYIYEGDDRVKTEAVVDNWMFENSAWEYDDSIN